MASATTVHRIGSRPGGANRSGLEQELRRAWKYRQLYLLLLPTIVFFLIFSYVPNAGLVMAFQNYSPVKGFLHSPWVGFEHFRYLFGRPDFRQIFINTIVISA